MLQWMNQSMMQNSEFGSRMMGTNDNHHWLDECYLFMLNNWMQDYHFKDHPEYYRRMHDMSSQNGGMGNDQWSMMSNNNSYHHRNGDNQMNNSFRQAAILDNKDYEHSCNPDNKEFHICNSDRDGCNTN
jgi:hypothetical protein